MRIVQNLKNPSDYYVQNGVNALDLIPSIPVNPKTLTEAKYLLEQNFGTEYDERKWIQLITMFIEDGWTEERFKQTFKWFLKNKKFSAWMINDWFNFEIKLYHFLWVRNHCNKNGLREVDYLKTLDCYNVHGQRLFKQKDENELPFEKVIL